MVFIVDAQEANAYERKAKARKVSAKTMLEGGEGREQRAESTEQRAESREQRAEMVHLAACTPHPETGVDGGEGEGNLN
jgi:hypothetical protein